MTHYLGLDLGGTMIKAIVLDADAGTWQALESRATVRSTAPDTVAGLIDFALDLVRAHPEVRGIGLTVPGHFDDLGRTLVIPNVPGDWVGQEVKRPVAAATGLEVTMINDARAFGLAEARLGAARGASMAIGVALGTGIGGVVVKDGNVIMGRQGRAGEIGHQVLVTEGESCGCGNHGCLETLARSDVVAAKAGQPSMREAAAAARAGDERALAAIEEAAYWIGIGLGNVATVLDPEVIFIGGGIAQAGDLLFEPVRRTIAERAPLIPVGECQVVAAALGPDAGAIGAALAASIAAGR